MKEFANMKVLLDTNIILDLLLRREHFDVARQIIEDSPEQIDFCITSNILTDIYYIYLGYLTKKSNKNANISPINQKQQNQKIVKDALASVADVVDIISVTREDCLRAFRSKIEDYEDAVEVESAISADIDCIITRDTKDFKLSPIPTYSPEDFLISIKANLSSVA